ncbi:hypothetical protein ACFX16_037893 [Malus domestica]
MPMSHPPPYSRRHLSSSSLLASSIFSDPFNFTTTWNGSNVCSYTGVYCAPVAPNSIGGRGGRVVAGINLRALCMVASVTALLFMVTAREATTMYIYGFPLPVNSKWSFANAFEYLVGVSATVTAHSLMQLLISVSRLLRKSPLIPSRNHAWLTFAGDQ